MVFGTVNVNVFVSYGYGVYTGLDTGLDVWVNT